VSFDDWLHDGVFGMGERVVSDFVVVGGIRHTKFVSDFAGKDVVELS
jgi:hypothetical protein